MSNDRNTNNFWKNVATGVGVVAAGAALAYLVSELFNEESSQSEPRCEELQRRERRGEGSTSELRNRMIDKLNSGTYECNICLEEISRYSKVVSCKNCYTINHLKCIKHHYESSESSGRTPDCPSCRASINYELHYYCFCGKELNPKPRDSGLTPHSCKSKCSNTNCRLRCHPGPCDES